MAFSASISPDITESLVAPLTGRQVAAVFQQSGFQADIAIGGLPFRLAMSDENPGQRQTAPIRKQQFDASNEAGEQSLDSGYWLRSQTSWHRGAGISFYDPGVEEETAFRFAESVGVDVWTRGQISLLKKTAPSAVNGQTGWHCATVVLPDSGQPDRLLLTYGDKARTLKDDGTLSATVTVASGMTAPAVYGTTAWVGTASGVYSIDVDALTATQRYTDTDATVFWAKSRLIAAKGASLYELTPFQSPAGAFPTPLHTHELADWTWTAVAEAPGAILAAGHSGGSSAIYKFTLDDDGSALPVLGAPIHVGSLPPGETIHALYVYLESYLALGTSRGVRVGLVDQAGNLQYGPLTVETSEPVRDFAARDSFLFAAVTDAIDGASGAVRIDLAEEITPLRFAWAWDAQTHVTGTATSVAFLGTTDRLAVAVDDENVFVQSATLYEQTGRLVSGAVRYGTTEPKTFRSALLRGRLSGDTSVTISSRDRSGSDFSLFTYGAATGTGQEIATSLPTGVQEYLSLRLDLHCSDDGVDAPVVEALTLKALPAPRRQRLISYPLQCFDAETDRFNVKVGASNSGLAWSRYAALEALEDQGATVQVQDFTNGESFTAVIEEVRLERRKSPDRHLPAFGGIATVVVRKLL